MRRAASTTLLEEALEAWKDVRSGVLAEAESVPDARYDWKPAEESRSVSELLRHILESGLMAAGELARVDGDFTRRAFPEFIREYAGHLPRDLAPGELRDHLASTFQSGADALREQGDLHMLQQIRRFDGLSGTRLAWFYHHIAHESYHRGQLALHVRQLGRIPALTRRIQGYQDEESADVTDPKPRPPAGDA